MYYIEMDQRLAKAARLKDSTTELAEISEFLGRQTDGWQYLLSCFDADSDDVGVLAADIAGGMMARANPSRRSEWIGECALRLTEYRTATSLNSWNWVVRCRAARALGWVAPISEIARRALLEVLSRTNETLSRRPVSEQWEAVSLAAVRALSEVTDEDRVSEALRCTIDARPTSPGLRRVAAEVLGIGLARIHLIYRKPFALGWDLGVFRRRVEERYPEEELYDAAEILTRIRKGDLDELPGARILVLVEDGSGASHFGHVERDRGIAFSSESIDVSEVFDK